MNKSSYYIPLFEEFNNIINVKFIFNLKNSEDINRETDYPYCEGKVEVYINGDKIGEDIDDGYETWEYAIEAAYDILINHLQIDGADVEHVRDQLNGYPEFNWDNGFQAFDLDIATLDVTNYIGG